GRQCSIGQSRAVPAHPGGGLARRPARRQAVPERALVRALERTDRQDTVLTAKGTAKGYAPDSMTDSRTTGSVALLALSMLLAGSALRPAWSESTGTVTPKQGATKQAAAKQGGAAQCNPATFRMVLDVGHVEEVNFGATSARGAHEYDFNLRLAK